MMRGFTPRRASWLASIRPVGPAPTTRTSTSGFAFRCDISFRAIILVGSCECVRLRSLVCCKGSLSKRASDMRRCEALGGDQLAEPLARIEHAGLYRVQRYAEDGRCLFDLLAMVVHKIDNFAMRCRELRQAAL